MQPALSVDHQGQPRSDSRPAVRTLDFSLCFEDRNAADRTGDRDPHRLLLEAASFADEHDFCALWLPENACGSSGALSATSSAVNADLAAATKRVAVRAATCVLPAAPVQAKSPVWVVSGKDSELFKTAAQIGAHILTHLLGRSIESLAKDIALYRRTWTETGHSARGYVTLVVATLVGEDEAVVKQAARAAMRDRLRTDLSLLHEAAWNFPGFAQASDEQGATLDEFLSALSGEQLDALVQFAAERYVAANGLFGGRSRCLALVDRLKQIGVDEIGCLIDFGWPTSVALEHLPALNDLRLASNRHEAGGIGAPNEVAAASTNGNTNGHSSAIASEPAAPRPLGPCRTRTQQKLADLWQTLLDVPEVDPGDNFFDLGGHSLLAARAVSEIDRTCGARIPIKTLMVSSLSQVASEIDRLAAGPSTADRRNDAQREASPKSESPNVGRLTSWFKNMRNGDRFQDGGTRAE